jgi:hypothetical protein
MLLFLNFQPLDHQLNANLGKDIHFHRSYCVKISLDTINWLKMSCSINHQSLFQAKPFVVNPATTAAGKCRSTIILAFNVI